MTRWSGLLPVQMAVKAATIPRLRSSGVAVQGELVVAWSILATTMIADNDFEPLNGYVVFAEGSSTAVLTVPLVDDDEVEFDETFAIQIDASPDGAWIVGTTATPTVTVSDNDVLWPSPGNHHIRTSATRRN